MLTFARASLHIKQLMLEVTYELTFTLEEAMKAQKGSRCIAILFLQPRR
jgi:hypothetical protein